MIPDLLRQDRARQRRLFLRRPVVLATLFAVLFLLQFCHPAKAANGAWLIDQIGTQDWSNGINWVSGTVPGALTGATNPDIATFGSNSGTTLITVDAGRNVRSLLFNGTNALGLYTIGSAGVNLGGALRLSSGGNVTVSPGTLTATTFHAPIILEAPSPTTNGTYTFTNNATNVASDPNPYKLNLLGDISGGTTTGSLTLNFTGTTGNRSSDPSANLVSGLISNGGAAGGLAVTVTGSDTGNRGAWSFTNNNNSYTGTTTISAGTLIFSTLTDAGVNSALGAGDTIQLNAGAQAKYIGAATSTNRTILGNGGTLYANGSGSVTLNGAFTLNGGMTFRGGQNIIINSVITGSGGLSRTDPGTVFLNQANTFNGNIGISDGAFRFGTIADKLVNSPLGAGSTITFGQNSSTVGRIEFTGLTGGSSNRDFILSNGNGASAGNGRIDNTVAGQILTLSGTVRASSGTAAHLSSLNLTGVGDGIMSGIIGGTNASATTANNMTLTKNGSGTWALSNANIYYGPTNISAGTLLAMNAAGSATGTGNVTTSATGALGGTGFVTSGNGGSITIASGTRLMIGTTHGLAAGSAGPALTTAAAGTLRLGTNANVALTLAGILQFDLFSSSDGITAGGADKLVLQTTAPEVALGGVITLADVTGVHAPWRAGIWQLFDWAGIGTATQTGAFTYNFASTSLASGYTWNTDDLLTTGSISVEKLGSNHTWTGATSASWADGTNWEALTVPSAGTDVFFAASPTNPAFLSHNIDGDKTVRNMFFSGEADHTINTGSGGVLYADGGYLEVLGGSQRFASAQLRPRNGTIGSYRIINEGTLRFDQPIMYHRQGGSGNLDIVFSGSGDTFVNHFQRRTSDYEVNLRFNGPGTVTFTGSSSVPAGTATGTITGTTTVNGGKIRLNNELNLGSDPAVLNPAQLTLDGGTLTAYATFVMDDTNRGVTLGASGGTIEVEGTHVLTLANIVTGAGGLTKAGPGTLLLTADNTYTGTTSVNAGTLLVNGDHSSATGGVTVNSGATLGGTGTIGSNTTIASGATITSGTATGVADFASGNYLSFSENLTVSAGSTWLVNLVQDLDGSADFVNTGGALNIAGANLSVAFSGDYTYGNQYQIARYGSLSSQFAGLTNDAFFDIGGRQYQINYGTGGAGGYITLTAVPEPGTYAILCVFLAGLWVMRRHLSGLRPVPVE